MPGLEIKKRGGVYQATGSVAGRRVRRSLKTGVEAVAAQLCIDLEARLWKGHIYGDAAVRTFEEAALSYQKAEGERRFLAPLIRHFRGRVLGSIKPEEIRQAARQLYPGRKPGTWNRNAVTPARAVINHAAGLGWCAAIAVDNFPTERVRRAAVDRSWIDAFLTRADGDGLAHLAAGMLFMWQTGTRISEAARVLPEHIDLKARTIVLARTKEGDWETRHISRELMLRLANLPMIDGEPIFGYASRYGLYLRAKAVCRRAGIKWVPPHQAGRHSFATNALRMGADLKQVMTAGGWKSARMVLEIYAHADDAGRVVADMFDTNRAQPKPRERQTRATKGKK